MFNGEIFGKALVATANMPILHTAVSKANSMWLKARSVIRK